MKTGERQILSEYIRKANRYLENAKHTINNSPVEYGRYQDEKYVCEAAGIAYRGALKAIQEYLIAACGYTKDKLPKTIEGYQYAMKKIPHNGKLSNAFATVYDVLHIGAYYNDLNDAEVIKIGFQRVKEIINILSK
ncbi:MAG: DUF5618 family protein [Bacteroidetes bacterium]|nr:DUF5618 family protein [Bacteroidota bacterium]